MGLATSIVMSRLLPITLILLTAANPVNRTLSSSLLPHVPSFCLADEVMAEFLSMAMHEVEVTIQMMKIG
jgi:hypothetical protein